MDIIIRTSAIALITVATALIIKKSNPENAFVLGIAASAVIITASLTMLSEIKTVIEAIILRTELSSAIFSPLLKCTVIAVTVKIVSSLCRDSGQGGIASSVEFIGAAAAIFTALPLINSLLNTIGDLL